MICGEKKMLESPHYDQRAIYAGNGGKRSRNHLNDDLAKILNCRGRNPSLSVRQGVVTKTWPSYPRVFENERVTLAIGAEGRLKVGE